MKIEDNDPILGLLKEFLFDANKGDFPRRWLTDDDRVEVYARVAVHNGKRCLEFDGICFGPDFRSCGETQEQKEWIKGFFQKAHEMNTLEATSVQSVMDSDIAGWLLLKGWIIENVYGGIATLFYRAKNPARRFVQYHTDSGVL